MRKKIIFIIFIIICIIVTVYYFNFYKKENSAKIILYSELDKDKIWDGIFGIAWKELCDYFGNQIEFENEHLELVDELNKINFNKNLFFNEDYYLNIDKVNKNLKKDIYFKAKNNNNYFSNKLKHNNYNGIIIYSLLKKEFNFFDEFYNLEDRNFAFEKDNYSKEKVACFGISNENDGIIYNNIEILYYNINDWIFSDCVVKLNADFDNEIILYSTEEEDSFDEMYNKALNLEKEYSESKVFNPKYDYFIMPYLNLNFIIDYDVLCNKNIRGTENDECISLALQNINISLNTKNKKVSKKNNIHKGMQPVQCKALDFCKPFYIFIKSKNVDKYYFAMRISNLEFLEVVKK